MPRRRGATRDEKGARQGVDIVDIMDLVDERTGDSSNFHENIAVSMAARLSPG
jgi:hypothetical protein